MDANKKDIPSDGKKIVEGKVKQKKKSAFSLIGEAVEDTAEERIATIVADCLVPMAKKIVSDIVNIILYGNVQSTNAPAQRKIDRVSYDGYSSAKQKGPISIRKSYNFSDMIFDSRQDAMRVLSRMKDIIIDVGYVSVGDFYELIGSEGDYTDFSYGWSSLRDANVISTRDGFVITLPNPSHVKFN